MIPFLAIYAKGGESMSPKQKDRTTTHLKNSGFQLVLILERVFQMVWFSNWYLIMFKRGESSIFKINILKPSWTLRGDFIEEEFCLSQRKSIFETKGENFKSWKCFAKSYSFTFDYLQKNFEKDLQKNLQKQNMWCKRGPKC